MIMLKNRFMRLLTTIIFSAVLIVGASAIEIISTNFDWEWNIPDGSIFFTTMLTVAVCLVGQFFGDIMDVDAQMMADPVHIILAYFLFFFDKSKLY
jgi:hypothetical protein